MRSRSSLPGMRKSTRKSLSCSFTVRVPKMTRDGTDVSVFNSSIPGVRRYRIRVRAAAIGVVAAAMTFAGGRADAAAGMGEPGRLGLVVETAAEFGGDDLVKVFYTNGSTQNIRAGQGVTAGIGAHYQPYSLPIDFAATVGYKFVRTAAYNTDLGVDRVVVKFTGSYALPNHFWIAAGPVWHTATKLKGDGYVPNVDFDDSVGATVGIGWRWIGLTYTNIKYRGAFPGSVDASNEGVTFAWKF
jgi:hypothetical protein